MTALDWDETLAQLNHSVTLPIALARWEGEPNSLRHIMMRRFVFDYYLEWNPYPSPEAREEADREGVFRPGDFAWHVRKRFGDPTQWD